MLQIVDTTTEKIHMPVFGVPWIDVKLTFQLTNKNFFPAEITGMKTHAKWDKFTMYNIDMVNNLTLSAPALSVVNSSYVIRQRFDSKLASDKVKILCIPGWQWKLFEQFGVSATISMLLTNQQVIDTYYGYVGCYDSDIVE